MGENLVLLDLQWFHWLSSYFLFSCLIFHFNFSLIFISALLRYKKLCCRRFFVSICLLLASTAGLQYLERSLLLLVTWASDLPVRTIKLWPRIAIVCLLHLHSKPPLGDLRRNTGVTFGMEKLEWCGCRTTKTFENMYSFRQNTRTWRTDRQTDTGIGRAYVQHRATKTMESLLVILKSYFAIISSFVETCQWKELGSWTLTCPMSVKGCL